MKSLLIALLLTCGTAWAGGELPFPFEDQKCEQPLAHYFWTVDGLPLEFEAKICPDENSPGNSYSKVWVRGTDGYVWDRVWTQGLGYEYTDEFEAGGYIGHFIIFGLQPENSYFELDGEYHFLNLKP